MAGEQSVASLADVLAELRAARAQTEATNEHARQAEEHARQAEEHARQAEEHARQAEEHARQAKEENVRLNHELAASHGAIKRLRDSGRTETERTEVDGLSIFFRETREEHEAEAERRAEARRKRAERKAAQAANEPTLTREERKRRKAEEEARRAQEEQARQCERHLREWELAGNHLLPYNLPGEEEVGRLTSEQRERYAATLSQIAVAVAALEQRLAIRAREPAQEA